MVIKLGDICKFQSGGTPSRGKTEFFNGTIPWITTTALNGENIGATSAVEWISEQAIKESAAKIVPAFSVMVGTRVGVGKVAINTVDMSTSQDIVSLLDIDEKIWDKTYLCRYLQAKSCYLNSQARGATIKGIKIDVLSGLEIPKIPLKEQILVSQLIGKVKNIIDFRQRQLQNLDELVKARFVELFGDPQTNPENYPIHQLSEYIDFLTSGSRGWAQYCADDGSEWFITIKNVKDCRISVDNMQSVNAPDNAEAKRTKVQEGDLLISITADLGRTGVVTKAIAEHGAYINQHLTCIRLNKEALNPLYVAYFMESSAGKEQFESKNQSAVKAGLNFNSINSLRLMVPPMDKQSAFVEFVKQVDKSKVAVQKALDEAQLLFDSLMQKYFG